VLDWPTGGLNSAGWRAELRRDTGRGPAQAPSRAACGGILNACTHQEAGIANGAHAQLCGLKEGFEAVLSAGSVVGSSKNPAVVQGSRRPRIAPEIGHLNN